MLVRAVRDHFAGGEYRKDGEEFEYTGKAHRHIEPVNEEDKKPFEEELKKVTAEEAKTKADRLAKEKPAADKAAAGK